ncbi:hypothetical protein NSP63_23955, partial [Salmonella enterica]|nr:hypothetical protein [Salmonella enterica]
SASDNVMLPQMHLIARLFRNRGREEQAFVEVAQALSLHPNAPQLPGGSFSGGNAQKLMVGRWTNPESNVRLLLMDEPTQG